MEYRRSRATGGTFFFTVNLNDRSATLLVDHIDSLRAAIGQVKARHPFDILAMVVLPDHLHALWRLPEDDGDYPLRWSLIKAAFSRQLPPLETVNLSRSLKRERLRLHFESQLLCVCLFHRVILPEVARIALAKGSLAVVVAHRRQWADVVHTQEWIVAMRQRLEIRVSEFDGRRGCATAHR